LRFVEGYSLQVIGEYPLRVIQYMHGFDPHCGGVLYVIDGGFGALFAI
jgi:hypothetical protein